MTMTGKLLALITTTLMLACNSGSAGNNGSAGHGGTGVYVGLGGGGQMGTTSFVGWGQVGTTGVIGGDQGGTWVVTGDGGNANPALAALARMVRGAPAEPAAAPA